MNTQSDTAKSGSVRAASPRGPQPIELRKLFAMVQRRLVLMLVVGGLVVVAAAAVVLRATPEYTATSSVMIDTRKEQVVSTEAVLSSLDADSGVVDTEVQVLSSRQLASKVATALNLAQDPEFNTALKGPPKGPIAILKQMLKRGRHPAAAGSPADDVVDQVLGDLSVKRAGTTYVINISFTSQSAARAAQVANEFATLYLQAQVDEKSDANGQATSWLNDRLAELRPQVQAADAALQNYRVSHNLMSANATGLTEAEISGQNQQLAQARAQAAEDQSKLDTAKAQLAAGQEVGAASDSDVVRALRAQRATASATLADLQGRLGPRNPDLQRAQRQLADIDANIAQETSRVISSLDAQANASNQRLAAMQSSVGRSQASLANSNRAMVEYNDLQRTSDASRDLYEAYLKRYQETSAARGLDQADASLISKAKVPTKPSSPNIPVGLALGIALGALCALVALAVAENLDTGLLTSEEVERRLKVRYLTGIPALSSVSKKRGVAPQDYLVENPLSGFAEAFRNLRAAIQFTPVGGQAKVVAVTSALPGEGKTIASICLARSAAIQGLKVAVVDCDLRRHNLENTLQIKAESGLAEVLSGQVKLDKALVADIAGVMILPQSGASFSGKDLFGSEAMNSLIDQLRDRFDLVVLDTAPILPVVDTRVLAGKADVTVFLARWRKTPVPAMQAALRILSQTDAKIAGAALTQVDMRKQTRYAYGDPDYYYRQYKGYYTAEET